MAASYLLIRYKNFRFITPIACVFLLVLNISNAAVHPVSSGLSSCWNIHWLKKQKRVYKKDPEPGGLVFGSQQLEDPIGRTCLKRTG
jgi:hypothetical protein